MIRKWVVLGAGLLWIALAMGTSAGKLWAGAQAATPQAKPAYTLAEYNAYTAAHAMKDPQQQVKALDAFVMQYPMSSLLPYVYADYRTAYMTLKNYAQAIEYADRMIALGNKIDADGRLQAYYARAQAYFLGAASDKALANPDAATKARDAATAGLATLDMLKKPDAEAQDQFDQQKKGVAAVFNTIVAATSTTLKDYPAAVTAYKALLAIDPNAAATHYSLGVVYLTMTPPMATDGFWQLARAIALKVPNTAAVQTYLTKRLIAYQQASCDKLSDGQVNELLTLAASTADRPATFNVPSAADLDKARNDTANFIPALQMGGDAGKVMWLATCGLEYPDVAVKVMDAPVMDGNTMVIKGFRPSSQDPAEAQKEFDAATEANMTIKVDGQPEAMRLEKDSPARFTGTLIDYTQSPFMLTWDKAKINADDIPEEKGKKAPAKKAPVKKAPAN